MVNLYTELCRKTTYKLWKIQWNSHQHTFIPFHQTKRDCIHKPHRVISKLCCSNGHLYTLLVFTLLLSLRGFSPTYQTFKIIPSKLLQDSQQYSAEINFFFNIALQEVFWLGLDFWCWFVFFKTATDFSDFSRTTS